MKLGHPVPLSNLSLLENSISPLATDLSLEGLFLPFAVILNGEIKCFGGRMATTLSKLLKPFSA